jgi:hypothetical protein
MNNENIYVGLERCWFCWRYFIKDKYLSENDVEKIPQNILDTTPTWYGPDANAEYFQGSQRLVTRDMAIDAGDLSLEWTIY